MNWIIIGFFTLLLTSRFFSETLGVLPKATDLLDVLVIPILALVAIGTPRLANVDLTIHRRIFRLVIVFCLTWGLSYAVNFDRVFYPPALLFLFGMVEGPLLFVVLNRIIRDKKAFGTKLSKFLWIMVLVEAAAVVFVNIPQFIIKGNPDYISGTFGLNAYQFSAFLIIMGGFFLGRLRISSKSFIYGLAIQFFIVGTFILLQWRTAVPSFLFSYVAIIFLLYGKKIFRLVLIGGLVTVGVFWMFSYLQSSDFDLKYDDLLDVMDNSTDVTEMGKILAYTNTVELFSEEPTSLLVGTGPGTYVSRANYVFSIEVDRDRGKGVADIIQSVFGEDPYMTDVQRRYILPLYDMQSMFGSMQANNPASSILAVIAETGLIGFITMVMIYATLIAKSIRYLRAALASEDKLLVPLSSALAVGAIYLVAISPLDNYLEVGRVTLPVWLLFWTVSVLSTIRRNEREAALVRAQYQMEMLEPMAIQ
jgi:hypothetical protein